MERSKGTSTKTGNSGTVGVDVEVGVAVGDCEGVDVGVAFGEFGGPENGGVSVGVGVGDSVVWADPTLIISMHRLEIIIMVIRIKVKLLIETAIRSIRTSLR